MRDGAAPCIFGTSEPTARRSQFCIAACNLQRAIAIVMLRTGAGALLALAFTAAGCIHVPSRTLIHDRFDFGESVAESWKRQMLLNVVRIRYADAPVFLDVATIITSYSIAGNLNADPTFFFSHGNPNELPIGASATFANTPTVTYQPLTGQKFMQRMLQPIPPVAVFQMLQAGWSAENLLRISVRSINGLTNQLSGRAADPRFDQLVAAVTRLQQRGGLLVRIQEGKEGEGALVALPLPTEDTEAVAADRAEVQRLLGVDAGAAEYSLAFGLTPRSGTEVAVLTRSMTEIMAEYGFGVELPDVDRKEGRARGASVAAANQIVHIQSGPSAPADAYAAVPYRGRWFWIDDREPTTKVRFTLLLILSSLAETDTPAPLPTVTVPSR
jgi:hypothetical protein